MAFKKLNKESVPEIKEISMRIRQISITGLFGVFNHVIPLNSDERITIIHAPNGYGKTIMLKMLDGLFNDRHYELLTIPYKSFQVEFEDGSRLEVVKIDLSETLTKERLILNFYNKAEEKETCFIGVDGKESQALLPSSSNEIYQSIQQASQNSVMQVLRTHMKSLEIAERTQNLEITEWFIQLKRSVNVYLIESQRLFTFSDSRNEKRYTRNPNASPALTVDSYSAELVAQIKERLAKYASVSQSLDRSFPTRLLKQSNSNGNYSTYGEQ